MASVELLVEDIWFSIFDLLPLHSKLLVAQVNTIILIIKKSFLASMYFKFRLLINYSKNSI
jgi:hypothetical protein